MTNHAETQAFVDAFFPAVERGDINLLRTFYNEDARIWHSRDEIEETVDQNMQLISSFIARVKDRKYEQVRRDFFEGGFVQTHVVTGILEDGSKLAFPVALICRLKNGKIQRLEEYFDGGRSPMKGFTHTA